MKSFHKSSKTQTGFLPLQCCVFTETTWIWTAITTECFRDKSCKNMELVLLVQVEFIKILIGRNRIESLPTHHRIEVFLHFKQVVEKRISKKRDDYLIKIMNKTDSLNSLWSSWSSCIFGALLFEFCGSSPLQIFKSPIIIPIFRRILFSEFKHALLRFIPKSTNNKDIFNFLFSRLRLKMRLQNKLMYLLIFRFPSSSFKWN